MSVVAVASSLASSLAFLATPGQVSAAGLGKVVVFSALGQPLRAEIEVNATAAELSGMRAQLASQEAFKQAGLDYTTSLRGITFTLDRRAGKKPVIRVASDTPISEPLVDVLVELNWPTGRLVREYTFLLDPPEVVLKNTRVATVPVVSATSSPGRPAVASSPSSISEETRARAIAAVQGQGYARIASGSQTPAPAMSVKTRTASTPVANTGGGSGDTYVVKQGDTLRKIAGETRPDGVTLEQMLIGLLRANQQAFGGGNMNRLKTGKTLTIPDKGTVESISPREARRIVATQTAEWHAYRSRLASIAAKSPAADSEARQGVAGKITAKVEDKFPEPGESGDQVKVSGSGAGRSGQGRTAGREDAIARDKALKEASERVAMLEQNVAKLQQLLELKDQTLAELQKQADANQGKSAVPASEPTRPEVVEPPKPAIESSAAPTLLAAGSAEPPTDAAQSQTTPATPASQPETQVQTTASSAEVQPAAEEQPAKRPVAPSQPPAPEPGFFETLLEDPMLLAGGGGILVFLLGGWLFLRRRKSNNTEQSSLDPLSLSTPSVSGSNLTANSVFRNTGGQSVDTSHTSQTDFSQASPGSIDTEEVDPVEEADVYMAYGRDAQAEEILLEAKRKEPFPTAINLKLLEIYANRKDARQVDAVAKELHAATGGRGADWEKAVTIGQRFAPENPLFGGVTAASAASMASREPAAATPRTSPAADAPLQQATAAATSQVSSGSANTKPEAPSVFETTLDMSSLDFDLGAGKADAAGQAAVSAMRTQSLDFSLDAPPASQAQPQSQPQPAAKEPLHTSSVLDFSLPESGTDQTPAPKVDTTAPLANDLEFDVDLTASTFLGNQMPRPDSDVASRAGASVPPKASPIDMSSIDLNLEATQPVARVLGDGATQSAAVVSPEPGVGANEDVSTKLDLAKAYEEMGDVDGARELLREVAKEGNSEQREKAKDLLARLGN